MGRVVVRVLGFLIVLTSLVMVWGAFAVRGLADISWSAWLEAVWLRLFLVAAWGVLGLILLLWPGAILWITGIRPRFW